MFTGIIEAVGEVAELQAKGGDLRVRLRSEGLNWAEVKLGDSIATNGVCLTVVELLGDGFWADVSSETLSHATLADAKVGDPVNLERAMLASSRFDGHIVSGHVDGRATLKAKWDDARSLRLRFSVVPDIAKYIAHKGSVCVDGVSLTVNVVDDCEFELNIVPHTVKETVIQHYNVGSVVNIEVDLIARYTERLLESRNEQSTIDRAFLAEHGFLKGRS